MQLPLEAGFQPVLSFPKLLSRAVRVLLTCIALVMATPSAMVTVREDISVSVAALKRSTVVGPQLGSRVAQVRSIALPSSYRSREPIDAQPTATEIRIHTRCAFLLNCSWLC